MLSSAHQSCRRPGNILLLVQIYLALLSCSLSSWLQDVRPAATTHAATAAQAQHVHYYNTTECQLICHPAAALSLELHAHGSTLTPQTQQSPGHAAAALLQEPVTMPAVAPQSLWDSVAPAHNLVTSSDEECDAEPEADPEVVEVLLSLAAGKGVHAEPASRQAL